MYPGLVVVRAFELSVTKEEESRPLAFLQNPILINVQLTTADLDLAGGEDALRELDPLSSFSQLVMFWHYRGNQWEGASADTQADYETLIAQGKMPRLGLFALTIVDRNPTGPFEDPNVN